MKVNIDIKEIEKIAPMPVAVTQLSKIAFDPNVDVKHVARIIELDQVLTSNVISWGNSAWSGSQVPVVTVKDAVVRFGIQNILKLAIGKRVSTSMKKSNAGYELGENELWRHSITAALTAESLREFATQLVPRAAFTGALLHDIGKLLLGSKLTPEYITEIRRLMETQNYPYIDAEHEMLGTDHAIVGGEIARYWKFPEDFVYVIEHHHDYDYPANPLLDSVQIANAVTKLLGIGMGSEQMNINIHSQVPLRMGLDDVKTEKLCVTVSEKLADTEALWEV